MKVEKRVIRLRGMGPPHARGYGKGGYWGRLQTSRAVRVRTLATCSMSLMRMYSSGMVSDSEPPPGPKRRQGTPACQRWHVSSPV